MNVMDRLRAVEKQLGEIWKELTPFRGAGGGGGVAAHHLTHEPGGADAITVLPDHHTEHEAGGGDIIKLDDLGAPDDNTDLNASAAKHGLLPKLSNVVTEFFNGQGAFSTPSGAPAAHHLTHESGGADSIKIDDLAAPDDNTDLDVSITKHGLTPKAPNDTSKFLRGDATWQEVTSGGANVISLWVPDAFPASPTSQSDHFDDASLDVKWTEWDPGGLLTIAESAHFAKFSITTGASSRWSGMYQALPAGDCTIIVKILGLHNTVSNYLYGGIGLFQDAAGDPNNTDFWAIYAQYTGSGTGSPGVQRWSKWDSFGANVWVPGAVLLAYPMYLRARRNGTTWYYDASKDGLTWQRGASQVEGGYFSPAEFGLIGNNYNTGATQQLWFDLVLYKGSDDFDPPGQVVDFWVS